MAPICRGGCHGEREAISVIEAQGEPRVHRLPTTDYRPLATDHRPLTTDHRLPSTDKKPRPGESILALSFRVSRRSVELLQFLDVHPVELGPDALQQIQQIRV